MRRRQFTAIMAGAGIACGDLCFTGGAAANTDQPAQSGITLSAADRSLISQIETYLNGLTSLTANFLQVAADGSTRTGKAWLQRPGKMRFEYDPPDPELMVAGFGLLVYHDPALDQTTNIPLSATPLGILLAQHVVLSGDVTVTDIQQNPGEIDLTLIRTGKAAAGSLTLVFGTDPLELRQWKIVDAQDRETHVSLYDIAPGGPFPDSLFTYQGPSPIQSGG
jgi:outer membrane lipoprotein-sorting protein